jgi:hypothetical protein
MPTMADNSTSKTSTTIAQAVIALQQLTVAADQLEHELDQIVLLYRTLTSLLIKLYPLLKEEHTNKTLCWIRYGGLEEKNYEILPLDQSRKEYYFAFSDVLGGIIFLVGAKHGRDKYFTTPLFAITTEHDTTDKQKADMFKYRHQLVASIQYMTSLLGTSSEEWKQTWKELVNQVEAMQS